MTVQNVPPEKRYAANGVSLSYTIPFLLIEAGDLDVFLNGVELTSGFTLTGVGNPTSTITFTIPPLGDLYLLLNVPFQRLVDYQENGDFLAGTVNRDFDRIWQALKQLLRITGRSPVLGTNDVDGAGFYRAKGNGLVDLASAGTNLTAATNLQDVLDYVASILEVWDGPANNAANVLYLFPNNTARPIQDLSNYLDPLKGSQGIGHYNPGGTIQTVGEVLEALRTLTGSLSSQLAAATAIVNANALITDQMFSNTLEPAVVDLHFGTLQGVGWTASEPGLIVAHTVTASTSNTITLNNVTGLYPGQLIVYQATNGDYYTSVVKLIGTLTLTLALPLPSPVSNGGQLYNFYRDDAHANTYGFYGVVDDSLRQLTSKRLQRVEYQAKDTAVWTPLLGATLTSQTTAAYVNPGAAAIGERGLLVASTTVDAGCISAPVALAGGDYVTNIVVNAGTRDGGFTGVLDIGIEEVTAEGLPQTIAFLRISPSWGGVSSQDIKYTVRPGSSVRVRLTSPNAGPWTFYVGPFTHNRVGGYMNNLNRGKHVLLGDSWFTSGADFHNRLIAKLDKATVISAGVPGNRASQLISRFATDVTPQNPDFVWVMVGTNDYYANVNNNDFEQQINQLRTMIQGIGAQPIFFNATVGAISYVPEQLTKSRSYALNVRYVGQEQAPNGAGAVMRNIAVSREVVVAAAASVTIVITPGQTRLPAVIRLLTQSITGLTLSVSYASTADGAGTIDPSTFSGVGITKDFQAPRTDTSLRFVVVKATNSTGSSITATILADICWQQSLV